MTNIQSLSLRWNDYASYVAAAFESLRYDEDLVDVTLYCESRKIRAHKMLLSACSTYFKDVFKENPSQHPIIIFKNVKYADLHSLVEFMYKGEVQVLQESLPSFLHTANMLSVRGLSEPYAEEQNPPTTAQDQPRSMLAQKILQTQSQNLTCATITTDQVYFALAPSDPTFSPPIKTEPQPAVSQQFISKVLLKPTNDLTVPLDSSIVSQVQQQQTNTTTANLSHPSTTALQSPLKQVEHLHQDTKQAKPAMITMDEQIVAQGSTSQPEQDKQSLQQLVSSVLSTPRPVRIARILKQEDSLTTSKKAATTKTATQTTPDTPTKTRSEMYDTTTAQSQDISEFINVGESLATTCGDSNAYTQPEEFEMVCENIADRSESEETMEQPSGYEVQIVDMGVDNSFLNEDEQKPDTHTAMDGTEKLPEKKYKCNSCDKSFVTWKSLTMHSHIHSGRTKCNICGAVLSRTANLKRHMRLKHEP